MPRKGAFARIGRGVSHRSFVIATLSLKIDTTDARASATEFTRILDDIKRVAQETARVVEAVFRTSGLGQAVATETAAALSNFQHYVQERQRMQAQVQSAEDAARQREMSAQQQVVEQIRAIQRQAVTAFEESKRQEETVAQRSMQQRVDAEISGQRRIDAIRQQAAQQAAQQVISQASGPSIVQRYTPTTGGQALLQQQANAAAAAGLGGTGANWGPAAWATGQTATAQTRELENLRAKTLEFTQTTQESSTATTAFGTALGVLPTLLAYITFRQVVREIHDFIAALEETILNLDRTVALFKTVGGQQEAVRGFEVAREAARLYGGDLLALAHSYAMMEAQAKNSALAGSEVQKIFMGLAALSGALQKTGQETSQLMEALARSFNTGQVSGTGARVMLQFVRQAPNGLALWAQFLGYSSAIELERKIQEGRLSLRDLFINQGGENFGDFMAKAFGPQAQANLNTYTQAQNQVNNALTEMRRVVTESGFADRLIEAFQRIADSLTSPQFLQAMQNLGFVLGWLTEKASMVLSLALSVGSFVGSLGGLVGNPAAPPGAPGVGAGTGVGGAPALGTGIDISEKQYKDSERIRKAILAETETVRGAREAYSLLENGLSATSMDYEILKKAIDEVSKLRGHEVEGTAGLAEKLVPLYEEQVRITRATQEQEKFSKLLDSAAVTLAVDLETLGKSYSGNEILQKALIKSETEYQEAVIKGSAVIDETARRRANIIDETSKALRKLDEEAQKLNIKNSVEQQIVDLTRVLKIGSGEFELQSKVISEIVPKLREFGITAQVTSQGIDKIVTEARGFLTGNGLNPDQIDQAITLIKRLYDEVKRGQELSGQREGAEVIRNLDDQNRKLREQISAYMDYTHARRLAVNVEEEYQTKVRKGLYSPEQQQQLHQQIEEYKQLNEQWLKLSNSPLLQYMRQLSIEWKNLTETMTVDFIKSFSSALGDFISGLGDRLAALRNNSYSQAVSSAEFRLRTIPAYDMKGRAQAQAEIDLARANQQANGPSLLQAIFEPFTKMLDGFFKQALNKIIEETIGKELTNFAIKALGLTTAQNTQQLALQSANIALAEFTTAVNAAAAAAAGSGGGGGVLSGIGALAGGGGGGAEDLGMVATSFMHGGIAGDRVLGYGWRYFQGGGHVRGTDTVPAMLTPGEGVFTQAQMRHLAPVGERSGSTVNVHMTVVTPDADSFRRSSTQILNDLSLQSQQAMKRMGQG